MAFLPVDFVAGVYSLLVKKVGDVYSFCVSCCDEDGGGDDCCLLWESIKDCDTGEFSDPAPAGTVGKCSDIVQPVTPGVWVATDDAFCRFLYKMDLGPGPCDQYLLDDISPPAGPDPKDDCCDKTDPPPPPEDANGLQLWTCDTPSTATTLCVLLTGGYAGKIVRIGSTCYKVSAIKVVCGSPVTPDETYTLCDYCKSDVELYQLIDCDTSSPVELYINVLTWIQAGGRAVVKVEGSCYTVDTSTRYDNDGSKTVVTPDAQFDDCDSCCTNHCLYYKDQSYTHGTGWGDVSDWSSTCATNASIAAVTLDAWTKNTSGDGACTYRYYAKGACCNNDGNCNEPPDDPDPKGPPDETDPAPDDCATCNCTFEPVLTSVYPCLAIALDTTRDGPKDSGDHPMAPVGGCTWSTGSGPGAMQGGLSYDPATCLFTFSRSTAGGGGVAIRMSCDCDPTGEYTVIDPGAEGITSVTITAC